MADFFNWLYNFFVVGIYDLLVDAFAYFVEISTIASLKLAILSVTFAWDVAQSILTDLNLSAFIQQAWDSFDSQTLQTIQFFKVPEAINIVMSAAVTRYVMNFIPFV